MSRPVCTTSVYLTGRGDLTVYLREIKYIAETVRVDFSQKGESSSENCNKFERKMPTFSLFFVVFRFRKTLSLYGAPDA